MESLFRIEAFIYESKEANQALRSFLKQQHSVDALNFLEMAKDIRDAFPLLQEEEKMELVACLLNTYIHEKTPALNLSFEMTNHVWEHWKCIKETRTAFTKTKYNDLMVQVEYFVLRDMKLDVLPNFIHSHSFKLFVTKLKSDKKGKHLLKKLTITPNKYTYFGYTFSTLFETEIQNKDFEFSKMLLEDPLYCKWNPMGKNIYTASKSKLCYDVEKGNTISFAKMEGLVSCSISEARARLLSSSNDLNHILSRLTSSCSFVEAADMSETSKMKKLHLLLNFKSVLLQRRHTNCTLKWTSFDTESVFGVCKSVSPNKKHFSAKSLPLRFFLAIGLYSSSTVANHCRFTIQLLYHGEKILQGKIKQGFVQRALHGVCSQIQELIHTVVTSQVSVS